jgi:hypothetical protein
MQQPPVAAGTTDRRVLVIVVLRLPSSAIVYARLSSLLG